MSRDANEAATNDVVISHTVRKPRGGMHAPRKVQNCQTQLILRN